MGQIRKVNDIYYIEFYARGLLYSQVAGPDFVVAEELLQATEKKIAAGEALTIVREIELTIFFKEFLNYACTQFNTRTVGRFSDVIKHFNEFLNVNDPDIFQLSKATPRVFEAYKAHLIRTQKPNVVNFSILLLREIMEYGIKLGFIHDNPTIHVQLLSLPKKQHPITKRYALAQELLSKAVPLGKVCKLLQISDIARLMYYANLIPNSREEMYN